MSSTSTLIILILVCATWFSSFRTPQVKESTYWIWLKNCYFAAVTIWLRLCSQTYKTEKKREKFNYCNCFRIETHNLHRVSVSWAFIWFAPQSIQNWIRSKTKIVLFCFRFIRKIRCSFCFVFNQTVFCLASDVLYDSTLSASDSQCSFSRTHSILLIKYTCYSYLIVKWFLDTSFLTISLSICASSLFHPNEIDFNGNVVVHCRQNWFQMEAEKNITTIENTCNNRVETVVYMLLNNELDCMCVCVENSETWIETQVLKMLYA